MSFASLRLIGGLIIALGAVAPAEEGMWPPQQIPDIAASLTQAGLQLDPPQLANVNAWPMGAVVSLGGCSASFVSPLGLVATNHHCAFGAIQLNSSPQRNLIRDGFNAATLADELPSGPNARILVLENISDVTAQVLAEVTPAMDGLERQKAIEKAQKNLVAAGEHEAGRHCRVYSFFGGLQYRLFTQLEIKDVRVVFAPPSSVGNFGGEIDNWMWPRHAGDFTLIRAYVGKDGKPAAYAPDNVPYQPKHWLRIATSPLASGDYVMVAGYPGTTNRYALAAEFDHTATWAYPTVSTHYRNLSALVHERGKNNPAIDIAYANTVRGWENTLKNYAGQLEGFTRSHAAERKHQEEREILAWLPSGGATGAAALDAHAKMLAVIARGQVTRERDLALNNLSGLGLLGAARTLYRWAIEREKPDAERAPGFQQRDADRLIGGLNELQKRFEVSMDKQLMVYWLRQYLTLTPAQRISAVDGWLGGNDDAAIQRAVDDVYAGTTLGTLDERLLWSTANQAAFIDSNDTMIKLAVLLTPTLLTLENEGRALAGDFSRYRPLYLAGVQQYRRSRGEHIYPDANASLRLTFGHVVGYQLRDGLLALPFTTAAGIVAKATSEAPFDAPNPVLDAIRAQRYGSYADPKLGGLPVNFLADLDTTGGNSGSPVMNAKGDLVGLLFDGTWESVSSNWVFDRDIKRSICVDIRYVLWLMEIAYPAPRLLTEMGAIRKP
jgi:Peptidase S46